jgi:SAM-dependent methyltransferase
MLAHQIALRESLAFVSRWLPAAAHVLEVGCGAGQLAAALSQSGHRVVALDSNAERVAEARARGVDARVATFPEFQGEPFDAVLFTHSLHHVRELGSAVRRARELLKTTGTLVIEDFVWDELGAGTLAWAYAAFGAQRERLRVPPRAFRLEGDPVEAWRKNFVEHGLHRAGALRAALAGEFDVFHEARAPYFYRFACAFLGDAPDGAEIAEAFRRDERQRIARGEIEPLGWQMVLRPRA